MITTIKLNWYLSVIIESLKPPLKIYNKQIIKVIAAVIHKGTWEVYFKRAAMAVTSAIKNIVKIKKY